MLSLLQKKSYSQCNTQNLTNMLILRTVHQTFPVLTADLRHIFARGWHETKAPGRPLAASCPVLLHTYNNWAAAGRRRGGSGSSGASHHGSGVARLRLSTDLYRKCRRLAVCSPRSDTQPLLERIQCLQTTQFMQNYHYLQRWHYYLTRICFTLHFLLLDNSTGGGRPFALIRDGGIIFPINSSAPAGGSQTSLVVLSRST